MVQSTHGPLPNIKLYLSLGHFIVMVRKFEVNTSCVDVQ
jgi:hypothetical protein